MSVDARNIVRAAHARWPAVAESAAVVKPGPFQPEWRREKSTAFDLMENSTARRIVQFMLWGRPVRAYANANLSIYSAQSCNARCRFCVEELRPASRGVELATQKSVELDDERYFSRLDAVIDALRPLNPSVSVTGGEPSKDPRLPDILRHLAAHGMRKRTMTTNGSGLLDLRQGRSMIDWITSTHVQHLNISLAHPDPLRNARLMLLQDGLTLAQLREIVQHARRASTRVRLSCVLLREGVRTVADIEDYLAFAADLGVDQVIFRQLMLTDRATSTENFVVRYGDSQRVPLEPLLDEISSLHQFQFQRQILGYYYYVEVWRYGAMHVVFEEADLAQLRKAQSRDPELIHELVFHPNASLASTWQPWDGVLG